MNASFCDARFGKRVLVCVASLTLLLACAVSAVSAAERERQSTQGSEPLQLLEYPQSSDGGAEAQSEQPPQYDKAIFQKPMPSNDLSFLSKFAGAESKAVIRDKQYHKLLQNVVPDCIFHYGHDMSLMEAIDTVLKGSPLPFQVRDGRYAIISGHSGPYLAGRGFIWIDLQEGIGIGGFYFRPTNGEPAPTVTIFSKQVKERTLALSQMPPAFVEDLNMWSKESYITPITPRYFITGFNEKILLEHDEDFCASADGSAPPPQEVCERMNAEATDIDLTAAEYLDQTNHTTNATAWMIDDPAQVAWIQVRDQTCSAGPNPLRCHVAMTREHIHVIVRRHPEPPHR